MQAGSASLVALALSAPVAVLVAALTMPFVSATALAHYWPALLVLPVTALLLHPPVLNRALNSALRLARRGTLPQPVTRRPLLHALGWMVMSWIAFGVSTWALAADLGASGGIARQLLVCTGGFALAWAAGFLVVFVPAGAGVREAALVLTLSPILGAGSATLLALISRLAFTTADLFWAGVAAVLRRGAPRIPPAGGPDATGLPPTGLPPAGSDPAGSDNSRTTAPTRGTSAPGS